MKRPLTEGKTKTNHKQLIGDGNKPSGPPPRPAPLNRNYVQVTIINNC